MVEELLVHYLSTDIRIELFKLAFSLIGLR